MADWSPGDYLAFADERSRPAMDLLAHVPLTVPALVYDLGCGPGNSTELLARRYPQAGIVGVDNSPAMLTAARAALPTARFIEADLATWRPPLAADLLFSNATYQWVPDHLSILADLLRGAKAGAVVAVQMPDNLDESSHRLMREAASDGPWLEDLKEAISARAALPPPSAYYRALKPLCARLDIWHTVYYHPLNGAAAVVEWVKSTGLRPFLAPLSEARQREFLADYQERIAAAYPLMGDGKVLLRFPRLFLVAVK